ncbi:MAG: transcriptional repressor NrdR [Clostridia bacterium]|nr:transcriptional repressor NrdR [Clostridia bacterium]
MKCIYCGSEESKVIDSRAVEETNAIKRRRECIKCGKRFNTYEKVEVVPMLVVKNDGTRQAFSIDKIKAGIMRACEKRPVSMQEIDTLVNEIERKVYNTMQEEISSKKIGEFVMDGLKQLDEVSYVRFASVYKQFKDISTFYDFLLSYEQSARPKTKRKSKTQK